jgi:putative SOS response-associated peptidase YedK
LRATPSTPHRRVELLRWGLVPPWARDPKVAHKLALARVEGITKSSAFRDAVRRRRCLVLVDGFYEWRRDGNRRSQPFFVRRADRAPFALAAVWERWHSRDGEIIESCAIVTQPSAPPVDAVHGRMPLVVDRDAWDRWLDPAPAEGEQLARLLAPTSPELVAIAVSPYVNDPRHDDPKCLEPAEAVQLGLDSITR